MEGDISIVTFDLTWTHQGPLSDLHSGVYTGSGEELHGPVPTGPHPRSILFGRRPFYNGTMLARSSAKHRSAANGIFALYGRGRSGHPERHGPELGSEA